MNVQQIVDRILEFGLDETDADNDLETRVLNDVNEVYNQLQNLISTMATPDYMETDTPVVITSGSGTVSAHLRNFSVYDIDGTRFLDETDLLSLEQDDPALVTTGAPTQYYITGGTSINTYPINSTTLRFRFYPAVTALVLTGAESTIKCPIHLHNVLVEGGNYLTSLREQGFHDRLDRGEKLRNWLNSQALVTGYLSNRHHKTLRVAYND